MDTPNNMLGVLSGTLCTTAPKGETESYAILYIGIENFVQKEISKGRRHISDDTI